MKNIFLLLATASLIFTYSCTKPDNDTSDSGEGTEQEGNGNGENNGGENNGSLPETKTYSIGDYYESGLAKGIVVHVDESGEHGLIISLDETRAAWSTEFEMLTQQGGEFSPSDGMSNTRYIKSLDGWQDKYPAFQWCDSKNALGLSAWYLPSYGELEYVNLSLDIINETLTEIGQTTVSKATNDCYWSSTEVGVQTAYAFSFFYGEISSYDTSKTFEHLVRAMRKF